MKLARSRKAVSTVIATILMINIAFATGLMVFVWSQGLFSTYAENSSAFFRGRVETMEETIALVNLRYVSTTQYKLNLTIRNIGYREVWIVAIYLNGTQVLPQVSLAWNNTGVTASKSTSGFYVGAYRIPSGDAITFAFTTITTPVLTKGSLLIVTAVSEKGARAIEQWKIAG